MNLKQMKDRCWELADRFDEINKVELRDKFTVIAQFMEELLGERDWGYLELIYGGEEKI